MGNLCYLASDLLWDVGHCLAPGQASVTGLTNREISRVLRRKRGIRR